MAQTGMMMPAVFGPVQAALTKLRAIATSSTMPPVALQLEHGVFHRAMTGIALPVAFEPARAVISEPWAMAMTDTAMSEVFEPVHAAQQAPGQGHDRHEDAGSLRACVCYSLQALGHGQVWHGEACLWRAPCMELRAAMT